MVRATRSFINQLETAVITTRRLTTTTITSTVYRPRLTPFTNFFHYLQQPQLPQQLTI